jgi:hypothetical protein
MPVLLSVLFAILGDEYRHDQKRSRPTIASASQSRSARSRNLVGAIAGGMLRAFPALAQRLTAAESELARLQVEPVPKAAPVLIVPDIGKRYLQMLGRLAEVPAQDPERGREELRGILGEKITLQSDKSGRFLWAEYSLGVAPLLGAGAHAEIMVAGARLWCCLLRITR